MPTRSLTVAFAALVTFGAATSAVATCPCPEIPKDVQYGGVGFAEGNAAFWGIVTALDYRPDGTFAEIDVQRTYTSKPIAGTVRIMLNTEPCAPEIRLGVGFLAVSYLQVDGVYRIENCIYSALEPFERPTLTGRGQQDLDAVREVLEAPVRSAIANAVVDCHTGGDEPLATFALKLRVFTDGSWDSDVTGVDGAEGVCILDSLAELEIPDHDQYPVSARVRVAAGIDGAFELSGIPFEQDSESVLRAAVLETKADDVASSARLLRASRQLDNAKTWDSIQNVCIVDGLVKAEALLDLYEPRDRTLADLFGCAARRDDVLGMLRVMPDSSPEERVLRQVLERLSGRDLSIRPITDTGPLTQSRKERLAILSWARQQSHWVHSAVLLEIVAEAAATSPDGTKRPSGVAALGFHRAALLRPEDEARFRELSAKAAPTGQLDPRARNHLTAEFARAEERRRRVELTAAEALAVERTPLPEALDPGPDMSTTMEPADEPEPEPLVEEEDEPLVDPAWCGLFGLFLLLVIGNVVRRGLTSPS